MQNPLESFYPFGTVTDKPKTVIVSISLGPSVATVDRKLLTCDEHIARDKKKKLFALLSHQDYRDVCYCARASPVLTDA